MSTLWRDWPVVWSLSGARGGSSFCGESFWCRTGRQRLAGPRRCRFQRGPASRAHYLPGEVEDNGEDVYSRWLPLQTQMVELKMKAWRIKEVLTFSLISSNQLCTAGKIHTFTSVTLNVAHLIIKAKRYDLEKWVYPTRSLVALNIDRR